ncbi:hypothetical protein L1987_46405 [Smallanthus sonchifolius]|uniref:Uncharacterized protein n=1 Tax=Smallanthus sonchifolius TaxID=185202 RepID=A0ACB9FZ31_9ASTR|nr:hypothetical protein L1987_46405 [Smallanthus sonchifolius]
MHSVFHHECIERMGENDGIWAWKQFNQLFNHLPSKPKRPPVAFFLFMEDFRKSFKKAMKTKDKGIFGTVKPKDKTVVQHGACLGLGLAALGTADEDIYDEKKSVLYIESVVAGEAAGISMGLLMVGNASEKASEMLVYAHETQHEKIIRKLTDEHLDQKEDIGGCNLGMDMC